MLTTTTTQTCGLCGQRDLVALPLPRRTVGGALGALTGLGLRRCRACSFEFVDPRPDDAALASFYQAQDYTAHEPVDDHAARRRAQTQLATIGRAGSKVSGASVLDVGCGGGHLLLAARNAGAQVCGVDPAQHAHAACQRHGLPVVPCLEDLGTQRFDGIVMSHALEHVPDVLATLRALRSHLQPSGWLCLEVPNRNSLRARLSSPLVVRLGGDERHRAFPIHLSYFSPLTLRRALHHSGFSIAFATTAGLGIDALLPRRDVSETISSPRSGSPTVAAETRRAAIVSFARTQLKRRYFDALFGENLIVVARLSRAYL